MNKESKVGGLKHAMQCLESCMKQQDELNGKIQKLTKWHRADIKKLATVNALNAELSFARSNADETLIQAHDSVQKALPIVKAAIAKAEGREHANS